jgi:lipid A 3-O-deacylase
MVGHHLPAKAQDLGNRPLLFAVLGLAFLVILPTSAHADEPVWSVISENDLFGGTDRNYTNGFRVERFQAANKVHPWLKQAAEVFPFVDFKDAELRQGFGLAHAIFTPANISTTTPDPTDRPYAGWAYVSGTVVATLPGNTRQDSVQINVGVVGPAAQGKWVQTNWHRMINGVEPRGWDSQIPNELGVELLAQTLRRFEAPTLLGVEFDGAVHTGLALGNVRTYASAGGLIRAGFDLDADFGPPRIRPSLAGAGLYDPDRAIGGYVFAGIEGRAVGRDIFLDGPLFRDGPSVDKRPFVYDLQAGVALNVRALQMTFSYVWRSESFEGQKGADQFGAISFSLAY